MANDASNIHPTNSIVIGRQNLVARTKNVETATNVYPGRLLEVGTNDDDVIVCAGSNPPCGWVGYLDTAKKYRPATITTVHSGSDKIAQVNGAGVILMAKLGDHAVVTVGELLTQAASGCVTPGTAGTNDIVAEAIEAVTTTTSAADILVRSRI